MCGLVGIANRERNAAPGILIGMRTLANRGQKGAGAGTFSNGHIHLGKDLGMATERHIGKLVTALPGTVGIGHTWYSTSGAEEDTSASKEEGARRNLQPIQFILDGRDGLIAHNGNLVNAETLRQITKTHPDASDTHIIADLLSLSFRATIEEALLDVLPILEGAFCLLVLFQDKIYAIKDRFGFHPLQIGVREEGVVAASESCVFDYLDAQFVFDIQPGDMVVIDKNGWRPYTWAENRALKFDLFEFIYFARPDSTIHGIQVSLARMNMGRKLAKRHPVEVDLVVPIPDSANQHTLGYYREMRACGYNDLEFHPWAIFKPHYGGGGRTFIRSRQEKRKKALKTKANPIPALLDGKRVAPVDDSLVRGTTMREFVIPKLRGAGARSVSVGIASPLYRFHDPYGIDTYRVRREIAAQRYEGSDEEIIEAIRRECGADGLFYLPLADTIDAVLEAAVEATLLHKDAFYTGPFTGKYPDGIGDLVF